VNANLTERPRRIALVTDFGSTGPYVGQLLALQSAWQTDIPCVPLISDLTPFRPELAAYLLPGLSADLPKGTLFLCVVDPGVGSDRGVLIMRCGEHWWVGPDNGLLSQVARRWRDDAVLWRAEWRPDSMSSTFHGRDWMLPLAEKLAQGEVPRSAELRPDDIVGADWPGRLEAICYVDHYGNLITGVPASDLDAGWVVRVGGRRLRHARTFSEVPENHAFWFENAFGLVEIAVNRGRAARQLGLAPGDPVVLERG
jgi:S-adenosylmethionine hydrolase